jgi:hypothetical protein
MFLISVVTINLRNKAHLCANQSMLKIKSNIQSPMGSFFSEFCSFKSRRQTVLLFANIFGAHVLDDLIIGAFVPSVFRTLGKKLWDYSDYLLHFLVR